MLKNIYIAINKKAWVVFIILLFTNCGRTGAGGNSQTAQTILVSGTISYERVPDTEGGLDYTAIYEMPIRRCLVKALEEKSNKTLANTYTNNQGAYAFDVPVGKNVIIVAYAISKDPIITVQDNFTSKDGVYAKYAIQSAVFKTEENINIIKNLVAESGFDSIAKKVLNARAAAPFAILDNCLKASDFFLQNRNVKFPDLVINWSKYNSTSKIGTSSWDGSKMYILGDLNQDTDEYDQHVIVHEWGHFFESKIGRTDSIGGPHTDGDILDPRIAFSEGWGNALSAMVLYPDTVYKDTGGMNQSITGIKFDVDENNYEQKSDSTYKIGWFSENTVQSILYDIFDPLSDDLLEPWDQLSSDSGEFYDIFSDNLKNTESLVTLFSFLNAYKNKNLSRITELIALLAKHEISPIQDEYGSEETNDGGIIGSLPIYKNLIMDTSVILNFQEAFAANELAATHYIKISGVEGRGIIKASSANARINVKLFYQGALLNSVEGISSVLLPSFNFKNDKTYVVTVLNKDYDANITVSLTKEQ